MDLAREDAFYIAERIRHICCTFHFQNDAISITHLSLLIDPVELRLLVADHIALLKPESDFLFSVLDRVGAVADITTDIDGEVAANGSGGGSKGVGRTEES